MLSSVVVFVAVFFAKHFRLQQAAEVFDVGELDLEPRVKALDLCGLPWASWLDEQDQSADLA